MLQRYIMQHDIYSLGIILLEIGLGISFVHPEPSGGFTPHHKLGLDGISVKGLKKPNELKRHLVRLASEDLPPLVGRKYAKVVHECLCGLDKSSTTFDRPKNFDDDEDNSDEDEDQDYEISIGVQFIEKVCITAFVSLFISP